MLHLQDWSDEEVKNFSVVNNIVLDIVSCLPTLEISLVHHGHVAF